MKDCSICSKMLSCRDPKKKSGYSCNDFTLIKDDQLENLFKIRDDIEASKSESVRSLASSSAFEEKDDRDNSRAMNSFRDQLSRAMEPSSVIPPDIKINDEDIPQVANFYEFCCSKGGLDQPPFPRQLWMFAHLLGEFCPRCTDMNLWENVLDFPVDYPIEDVPNIVQFLDFGKCPKCGVGKSELIATEELNPYMELALCLGQRCVTGDTQILTENGLQSIVELDTNRPFGYSPMTLGISGKDGIQNTNRFFKGEKEKLTKIHLCEEHSLTGTHEHPVMTLFGWKKLKDITTKDYVRVNFNSQVFGNTLVDLKSVSKNSNRMNEDLAFVLGLWVVDGHKENTPSTSLSLLDKFQSVLEDFLDSKIHLNTFDLIFKKHTWRNKWFFDLVGFDILKTQSQHKEIPKCIRIAPKNIVATFLSTMFEIAGTLNGNTLEFTSTSETLSKQTMAMLLNFGIPCRIRRDYACWIVYTSGSFALKNFENEIGFSSSSKKRDLNRAIEQTAHYCFEGFDNNLRREYEKDHYWEKVSKVVNVKPEIIYDVTVPEYHNFTSNGILSHNSGKSIGVSLISAYIIHRYLKLQDPTRVYSLTRNTELTFTMVGLTFSRAKSLLYNPIMDLIQDSPWFDAYAEVMSFYENKFGEEFYTIGKEAMIFKHRNLLVYPSSPSKRTLRGDTRFCTAVDEIGWFPFGEDSNDRERASANEVYEALDRSMLTVRGAYKRRLLESLNNIPQAYGLYASSPSAHNDKIMSLVRTFENSQLALGINLPTWEMNPLISRNEDAVKKAYAENHIKAERDYGANPPLADASFIGDISDLADCFSTKENRLGKYKYTSISRGTKERRAAKFTAPFKTVNFPLMLALDAGSTNNSFGLSLGGINAKGKVCVVGNLEIAPALGKPLDHGMIFDKIILPICQDFPVVRLLVDRWQSLKIVHDIETAMKSQGRNMEGVEYSLRRGDFDFVLDYMLDKETAPTLARLEMDMEDIMNVNTDTYPHCFKYKPMSHLLFQMATVRETAKTIDKGQGYTDDIFRSMFLLLAHLYDEDDSQWLIKQRVSANEIASNRGKAMYSSLNMGSSSRTSGSTSVIAIQSSNKNGNTFGSR